MMSSLYTSLSCLRPRSLSPFLARQHTHTLTPAFFIRHITSSSPPTTSPETPAASPPPEFEPLTYHVHRTPGQQLPVYHLAKAGGNKHLTRIRKISGNVLDLKEELKQALGLNEKEISVNAVNGHIVIKGWKKIEVARFLEEKHF